MPPIKHIAFIAMLFLVPDGAFAFDRFAGLAESEHQASDLSKALNLIMSVATPDFYAHKRGVMIEEYEKAPTNKALAVNIKSGDYWQTTDQDSKSVTGERTLEGCQLRFESPCKLLAVNDELAGVTGPSAEQDMPRLKYSGGFDMDSISINCRSSKTTFDEVPTCKTIWRPSVRKRLLYIPLVRWLWCRDLRRTGTQRTQRWQDVTFCRIESARMALAISIPSTTML